MNIGQAVGTGLGALAGLAAAPFTGGASIPGGMAVGRAIGGKVDDGITGSLSGKRRQMIRSNFDKMLKGNLVSDQEMKGFTERVSQSAGQAAGAQQAQLNRMAMTAGGPVDQSAFATAGQQAAKQATEGAIKAQGAAEDWRSKLTETRKAQVLADVDAQIQRNKETRKEVAKTLGDITQLALSIGMAAGTGGASAPAVAATVSDVAAGAGGG